MSKEKVKALVEANNGASSIVPPVPPTPAIKEKLSEEDRLSLDLAKARRETALAQAKEALAKNETAELAYKYVVLQLYMKYGLTAQDALSEAGDILRGAANQFAQG